MLISSGGFLETGEGVMNAIDVAFLLSMAALVVFFASIVVVEWRDARAARGQQPDAQVIQHPRSARRVDSAA